MILPRIANAEQSTKVLQVFEIDYFYGWYKDVPSTQIGGFMLKKWLLFGLLATIGIQCSSAFKQSPKDTAAETQRFNEFLDKTFDEFLVLHPESMSRFGKKENYDKLNDYSEAMELKLHAMNQQKLKELKGFDRASLDVQAKLSYDLFKSDLERGLQDFRWKDYNYAIHQQGGVHTDLPTFMINIHKVDSEKDLQDYIARLQQFPRVFSEVEAQIRRSQKQGVIPPKFAFASIYKSTANILKGAPFAKTNADSPLWTDIKKKTRGIKLKPEQQKLYLAQAQKVLTDTVKPAYEQLLKVVQELETHATVDDGAWKFPNGADFYNSRLARYTTTKMTADEIHQLGLKNVARLRTDMEKIQLKLGVKGSLQDFFKNVRADNSQYYPATPTGRSAYLKQAEKYLANIQTKVPNYFRLIPKTPMVVKSVEKYREEGAGKAFYEEPSDDGSRPGMYYVNLRDLKDVPKFEAEALLYHEGIPGHHFQIALGIELKSLPKYRRYKGYTAFVEGWALYTERLGKEMGGYQDDYAELGRLSMEMVRACRLVVDTGVHSKKWTREQAIAYMNENLPVNPGMQIEQVERYIIWPGQATAYMVGMLKIVELREKAQKALGEKFDIRDFHDVVLGNGAVSLDVLEALVDKYIADKNVADKSTAEKKV